MEGQEPTSTEPRPAAPELYVPETDEEAKAILEEDLKRIGYEREGETVHEDKATLEDMIGEAKEMRRRGTTFYLVPPVIEELSKVIKLLNLSIHYAENDQADNAIACEVEMARRLMWVKETEGGKEVLRNAREDEIRRSFVMPKLSQEIKNILTDNGLEIKEGKA